MRSSVSIRSIIKRLLFALSLVAALLTTYLFAVRPFALRWGATAPEVAASMPGDSLVLSPSFCATRAITIEGRPEDIWPWLAQMGYNRGGFYGYDLIENIGSKKGIHSLDLIAPPLEHPKPGDVLPISAIASLVFGSIKSNEYLIWRSAAASPDESLTWMLDPVDDNHTRLISRVRLRYHWTDKRILLDLFTEFGDHVAVPRILLGIKDRVEGRPPQSLTREGAEIMIWLLAMAEFATAMLLPRLRRWLCAWLLGLAACLVLLTVLYARTPVWFGAALVYGVVAMFGLSWRDLEMAGQSDLSVSAES